jgi:hypothetical protein
VKWNIGSASDNFYRISGLKCNIEKSSIMYTGSDDPAPDWIVNSGFVFVDQITVLGCNIDNKLVNINKNFDNATKKIRNLINFWTRFKLSLPGRLGVAKSLLLSQLNYLGCILDPDPEQLSAIKNMIYGFVRGGLNISIEKVTVPEKFGGAGMIDIDSFLVSQQCAWIKRLSNGKDDIYKQNLRDFGYGAPHFMTPGIVKKEYNPVLAVIGKAFDRFYLDFLKQGGNICKAPVLNNPALVRNRTGKLMDGEFFQHNVPPLSRNQASTIIHEDLFSNGRLKSLNDINMNLPFQISLGTYLRIGEAARLWENLVLGEGGGGYR